MYSLGTFFLSLPLWNITLTTQLDRIIKIIIPRIMIGTVVKESSRKYVEIKTTAIIRVNESAIFNQILSLIVLLKILLNILEL